MRLRHLCLALAVFLLTAAAALAQDPTSTEESGPEPDTIPVAAHTAGRYDPTGMSFVSSLQNRAYGGGELEVVRVVAERPGFTRYLVRYPSDGLTIQGFMNVPKSVEPPYRVVIVAHGFVNPDSYPLMPYTTPYADALAEAGFLVVHPNYRNHSGSDQGPNPFRSGYTIDVLNLIAILQTQPDVRPDAVNLFGHSMGGEVTLKALVAQPARIRAAVLYGAMGADAWENWNLINWKWAGGWFLFDGPFSPWRDRDAFALASPSHYLDAVQAAVQIHHGTADDTVPFAWSTNLADALRAQSKEVEFYAYPGAGHGFGTGSAAYHRLLQRTIAFLEQHNP